MCRKEDDDFVSDVFWKLNQLTLYAFYKCLKETDQYFSINLLLLKWILINNLELDIKTSRFLKLA